MAKQRPIDEIVQDVPHNMEFQSALEPDPEKEAMRARIAELEAQLGGVQASAPDGEPFAYSARELGYWRVRLPYSYSRVVKATDAANAYEVYRKQLGILASEHQPRVEATSSEEYEKHQKDWAEGRFGLALA